MTRAKSPDKPLIQRLEATKDCLTGRSGLVLFSRYLRNTGILPELDRVFGSIRRSAKGLPVADLFHQSLCFFCPAPVEPGLLRPSGLTIHEPEGEPDEHVTQTQGELHG
jgi:hypothetical protein